jgi:hypothetical protein
MLQQGGNFDDYGQVVTHLNALSNSHKNSLLQDNPLSALWSYNISSNSAKATICFKEKDTLLEEKLKELGVTFEKGTLSQEGYVCECSVASSNFENILKKLGKRVEKKKEEVKEGNSEKEEKNKGKEEGEKENNLPKQNKPPVLCIDVDDTLFGMEVIDGKTGFNENLADAIADLQKKHPGMLVYIVTSFMSQFHLTNNASSGTTRNEAVEKLQAKGINVAGVIVNASPYKDEKKLGDYYSDQILPYERKAIEYCKLDSNPTKSLVDWSPFMSQNLDFPKFMEAESKFVFEKENPNCVLMSQTEPTKAEDIDPGMIVMHKTEGKLTAYWVENEKIVSKTAEENEVDNIIELLPCIGQKSHDSELIKAITLKYGWTPQETKNILGKPRLDNGERGNLYEGGKEDMLLHVIKHVGKDRPVIVLDDKKEVCKTADHLRSAGQGNVYPIEVAIRDKRQTKEYFQAHISLCIQGVALDKKGAENLIQEIQYRKLLKEFEQCRRLWEKCDVELNYAYGPFADRIKREKDNVTKAFIILSEEFWNGKDTEYFLDKLKDNPSEKEKLLSVYSYFNREIKPSIKDEALQEKYKKVEDNEKYSVVVGTYELATVITKAQNHSNQTPVNDRNLSHARVQLGFFSASKTEPSYSDRIKQLDQQLAELFMGYEKREGLKSGVSGVLYSAYNFLRSLVSYKNTKANTLQLFSSNEEIKKESIPKDTIVLQKTNVINNNFIVYACFINNKDQVERRPVQLTEDELNIFPKEGEQPKVIDGNQNKALMDKITSICNESLTTTHKEIERIRDTYVVPLRSRM